VAGTEQFARTMTSRGATFSLATESPVGNPSRVLRPKQRVSAFLAGGQLTFDTYSDAAAACDPIIAGLRADLADLGLPAAGKIHIGSSWTDSILAAACLGGVPGAVITRRQFRALGDTTIAGEAAVVIERRDTIAASASGLLDQHVTRIGAKGSSATRLYVLEDSGKILLVGKELHLQIIATTATQSKTFVEKSTSVVELIR